MRRISLDNIIGDVNRLPSLPTIIHELILAMNKEDVSVGILSQGIQQDQALSARVLRVANSPFFGLRKPVASIHDAIVVLGFRAVSSLVTTAALTDLFKMPSMSKFDQASFWRHSLGTAVCARHLASLNSFDPETAYTAGLLHDIGRLLLIICHPEPYTEALTWREEQDCMLLEAERHVLGVDHMDAGAALAIHWNFAPPILDAAAFHHNPPHSDRATLTDLVHFADILSHALDMERTQLGRVGKIDEGAWNRLNLDWDKLRSRFPAIETEFQGYDSLVPG